MARSNFQLTMAKGEANQLLDELVQANTSDAIKETLKLFLSIPNLFEQLVSLKFDKRSTLAGEAVMTLEPSDCFRRLHAAVITGDIDSLIVEHKRLQRLMYQKFTNDSEELTS